MQEERKICNTGFKKTLDGKKRVQRHRQLREIIKINIECRGPMLYLDSDEEADGQQFFTSACNDGAACTDSEKIAAIIKQWPEPRPSPHYDLRVWNVLQQTLDEPDECEARPIRLQLPAL